VEAVLGEKLQYVVVKSQEDGIRAIDYLKKLPIGPRQLCVGGFEKP